MASRRTRPLLAFRAENWSARKFKLDLAVSAVFLLLVPVVEVLLHHSVHIGVWLIAIALIPAIAAATQAFRILGTAYGGWFLVLIIFTDLYVLVLNPVDFTFPAILSSAFARFSQSYTQISKNGDGFKDGYILLASAAFTLTGLTFIAVREVSFTTAVRLTLILNGYSFVFLLCIPAILQRDEGWHRLALVSLLNTTAIVGLTLDYSASIVDYIKDSEASIEFWLRHADTVRALSLFGYVGLALVPLFPTPGEVVFFLMLSYVVAQSTRAAYFLYLSAQVQARDQNVILRNLFGVALSKRTRDALQYVEQYRSRPQAKAKTVFWQAGSNLPQANPEDAPAD